MKDCKVPFTACPTVGFSGQNVLYTQDKTKNYVCNTLIKFCSGTEQKEYNKPTLSVIRKNVCHFLH